MVYAHYLYSFREDSWICQCFCHSDMIMFNSSMRTTRKIVISFKKYRF